MTSRFFERFSPTCPRGNARKNFGRPKKFLDLASRLGPGTVPRFWVSRCSPRQRGHRGEKFPVAFLPHLLGKTLQEIRRRADGFRGRAAAVTPLIHLQARFLLRFPVAFLPLLLGRRLQEIAGVRTVSVGELRLRPHLSICMPASRGRDLRFRVSRRSSATPGFYAQPLPLSQTRWVGFF